MESIRNQDLGEFRMSFDTIPELVPTNAKRASGILEAGLVGMIVWVSQAMGLGRKGTGAKIEWSKVIERSREDVETVRTGFLNRTIAEMRIGSETGLS